MKWIKLRYLAKGKRTQTVDMHGFEGPGKKPKDSVLMNGGNYVKKGEITTAYQLAIPPSNLCEIVDTQFNREKLRKLTVSNMIWDNVQYYDAPSGTYKDKRIERSIPPAFTILDGTDIFADLTTPLQNIENSQIAELKALVEKQGEQIENLTNTSKPKNTKTTKPKKAASKKEEKPEKLAPPPSPMSDASAHMPVEDYGNKVTEPAPKMENAPTKGVIIEDDKPEVKPNTNKFSRKVRSNDNSPIDTSKPSLNPFPV